MNIFGALMKRNWGAKKKSWGARAWGALALERNDSNTNNLMIILNVKGLTVVMQTALS